MKQPYDTAAAAAVALTLTAGTAVASDIDIKDPWARASAGMAGAGAAFMSIANTGDVDRLVSASADVSEVVELHTHIMEEGIMKMRRVATIDIPADTTVPLQPGGLHVMFIGLKAPLVEGQTVPVTLTFETAGEVNVSVPVLAAGARSPAEAAIPEHDGTDDATRQHAKPE